MSTARFTSTEAEAEVEQHFEGDAGEETEDSQTWPDYGDGKPKAVTPGETSKSEGKTGDQPQQAEGGAKAPPKENPPADPKPGTSKDPTDVPVPMKVITQDPTQATPQGQEEEAPVNLTAYVKSYQQAGKVWLDTVLEKKEEAYKHFLIHCYS